MNIFNKLFGGHPPDPNDAKPPTQHAFDALPDDLNLVPLDGLATGDPPSTTQTPPRSPPPNPATAFLHTEPQTELAYLEKYNRLQHRMDTSELYEIFYTLDAISDAISDINRHSGSADEFMENWKPMLNHIELFTAKKKLLESIESQMVQTIGELRDIHQHMFDALQQIKTYHSEREAAYATRKKLADELERKLRLWQDTDARD